MLTVDWTKEKGWEAPHIQPYGPIEIETSATVLHYGISAFEAITVCENKKTGKLQGFRCMDHLKHLLISGEHIDLPTFDVHEMLECCKQFSNYEKDWLKFSTDPDLFFMRILHMSTDKTLGVRTPQATKLVAILNPVLLKNSPVSVKCSTDIKKNWPLGHGQYRIAGNYGPILPAIQDAKENGFDDVLWLLDDYVKEMTQMNVFVL